MSFEKKIWVNVPDETKLPEVPEGQDALARFDADNMNRIEDGISDAFKYVNTFIKMISLEGYYSSNYVDKNTSIGRIPNWDLYKETHKIIGMMTWKGKGEFSSGCFYFNVFDEFVSIYRDEDGYYCYLKIDSTTGDIYYYNTDKDVPSYGLQQLTFWLLPFEILTLEP